jgi:hypothetical protein
MKKFTIVFLVLAFAGLNLMAQFHGIPAGKQSFRELRPAMNMKGESMIGLQPQNQTAVNKSVLDDPSLMVTRYDLQTNASVENRLYLFPDDVIGGCAMLSHTDNFTDRGTGVNYFTGGAWGTQPSARIESSKSGWPSYAPLGPNGEIVVNHHMTDGLYVLTRPQKGTGAWTSSILAGPPGAVDISWPRVITTGPDHMTVHIICLTYVVYQNLNLALLYYRSQDGGQTWDIQHQILTDMTSADYLGFKADNYNWADPKGDTICFVFGDSWTDLAIMKSNNAGNTWTKTVIWPCPYNMWAGGDTTGMFWCPDGSINVALDQNGKAHVVSGLMRANGDDGGNKYWYPFTDGLLYWNEDMPTWPDVLDPEWLDENGYYIGWIQDTMVWYAQDSELAYYYVSMSSQPTLVIDEVGHIFVFWAGVTNFRDVNNYMLRHIYGRASITGGQTWRDTIVDLTSEFIYQFLECVYPSVSPTCSQDKLQIIFQTDDEGGVYLNGSQGAQGQNGITDNNITYMNPLKSLIIQPGVGMGEQEKHYLTVSQNMPNPARGLTTVRVFIDKPAHLELTIYNSTGQAVMTSTLDGAKAGAYHMTIDTSRLTSGIYFYSVAAGSERVTKKMILH